MRRHPPSLKLDDILTYRKVPSPFPGFTALRAYALQRMREADRPGGTSPLIQGVGDSGRACLHPLFQEVYE